MPFILSVKGIHEPYTPPAPVAAPSGSFDALLAEKASTPHDGQPFQPSTSHSPAASPAIAAYHRAEKTHELRQAWAARDLMKTPVLTLTPEHPLSDAKQLMHKKDIRHIPIVSKDGHLIGMVSDRDLLKPADPGIPLAEVMSHQILTATPQTPIPEIARVMLDHRISCLPILSGKNGQVAGILTVSDILRGLIHRGPLELWV